MLGNLAFTLYEVFGYLLPGGLALLAILVLYWALFVPGVPLGIATYQPSLITWTTVAIASYLLGHAVQGIRQILAGEVEEEAVSPTDNAWMREPAIDLAKQLAGIEAPQQLTLRWAVRVLDEYSVQSGKPGDRDVFVYREGFYRGCAIALFFLTLALLVRFFVPGSSIQFTKGLFHVSGSQILLTALITAIAGRIYVRRYRRFAEYRVTRAILAALVLRNLPSPQGARGKTELRPGGSSQ